MDSEDTFFDGMKNDRDKMQEWVDAAHFFVEIRQPREPEPTEKTAVDAKQIGRGALTALQRLDRTGVAKAMSSKPGAIAGLAGGALFGVGTALASRGKEELGGKSRLEHSLAEEKASRDAGPEPTGFAGKLRGNISDFNASLASTARKHPVKAGLLAALGGAKAGTTLLNIFTKKG